VLLLSAVRASRGAVRDEEGAVGPDEEDVVGSFSSQRRNFFFPVADQKSMLQIRYWVLPSILDPNFPPFASQLYQRLEILDNRRPQAARKETTSSAHKPHF